MTSTVVSFSTATTTIPAAVSESVGKALVNWQESGMSILEAPFSGDRVRGLMAQTEARLRSVMAVPPSYDILFCQGGASAHFALTAMNLLGEGKIGAYVDSGLWAQRAIAEAEKLGRIAVVASGAKDDYCRLPPIDRGLLPAEAAYCHITTNESAQGLQYHDLPSFGEVPLVADMTGDFLVRPLEVERFGLIYASAQKSLGGSGLTLVIVRPDILPRPLCSIPQVFDYRRLASCQSRVNTPPVFAIFLAGEMLRWMEAEGGLSVLAARRACHAARLYHAIDHAPLFQCPVVPQQRSTTTLCFRLKDSGLTARFLEEAASCGSQRGSD
jgi:phosphoserine aminotransferase